MMLTDYFDVLPVDYRVCDRALIARDDALYVLQGLKSNSINLIFADPPYNIGKNFGPNWNKMSDEGYIEWCKKWLSECMRVLHPKGSFYFMAATQYMPYLDTFMSESYYVLSRIIWHYDSSGVQSKKKFGSLYEPILHVVKSLNNYTFNTEEIMVEAKTGFKRRLIDYRKNPPQMYNTKKVPGNVWYFPRVRYKMPEYEEHPAQKPEALLNRIILCSSNPGNVVLDPFGGTFTTGAVALKNDRRIISCEINRDYFDVGHKRLTKILSQKKEVDDA